MAEKHNKEQLHKGSCLCGKIRFEITGALTAPSACHCRECRKHSGHFEASVDVPRQALMIYGEAHLTWYHSSHKARRGFCRHCGASLLWDPLDTAKHDWTAVALGAFDTPTGIHLKEHIYVGEKGDYYDIADGLPQFDTILG